MDPAVEQFRKERERAHHTRWQYVEETRAPEDRQSIGEWKGKESFLEWERIMGAHKPLPSTTTIPPDYLAQVRQKRNRVQRALGQEETSSSMDAYSAEDFLFCSLLPQPKRILDFGAGSGRQAILFSTLDDTKLFALDAIESSYFSQRFLYRTLEFPLWEYFEEESHSLLAFLEKKGFGIVHLPAWRNDLLPTASFDLILFVWVLSEMEEKAAKAVITQCRRILKPGGFLYIRDMPHSHGWRTERRILANGFQPVFYPWKTGDEYHGIPRLYRYLPGYLNVVNGKFLNLFTAAFLRSFSPIEVAVRIKRFIRF